MSILLFWGCGGPKNPAPTPEEVRLQERATVLSKVMEGIDSTRQIAATVVEQVPGLQTVMDSVLAGKSGYGMFYLLNSGCSVCIGELLDFTHALDQSGLKIPVYVVTASRSHVPTVEYYLEQPEMAAGIEIHVVKHLLAGSLISERNRTVVVTCGDRPVEQFVFE